MINTVEDVAAYDAMLNRWRDEAIAAYWEAKNNDAANLADFEREEEIEIKRVLEGEYDEDWNELTPSGQIIGTRTIQWFKS